MFPEYTKRVLQRKHCVVGADRVQSMFRVVCQQPATAPPAAPTQSPAVHAQSTPIKPPTPPVEFTAPPPLAPQPSQAPVVAEAEMSGNVSSGQLDKKEIEGIAQELKKNLAPKPLAVPLKPRAQEASIDLNSGANPEDTIIIDQDGNIKSSSPLEDEQE